MISLSLQARHAKTKILPPLISEYPGLFFSVLWLQCPLAVLEGSRHQRCQLLHTGSHCRSSDVHRLSYLDQQEPFKALAGQYVPGFHSRVEIFIMFAV